MQVDQGALAGGALIGAGAGYAIGAKKVAKLTTGIPKEVLKTLKKMTKDEYVRSRVSANIENVHKLKPSKWAKEFSKIAEKATKDYPKLQAILKKATKTKVAFIAGFAALGMGLTALIAGKKNKE